MPDRKIETLRVFLAQGGGKLSVRARTKEFEALTDADVERIQTLYAATFGSSEPAAPGAARS